MTDRLMSCPYCDRVFRWGRDADSEVVEAQGENWKQLAENAHWKLSVHVNGEHKDLGFQCPRRAESPKMSSYDEVDWWNTPDETLPFRSCSYCGSMHSDDFFQCVDANYPIHPTDKDYKVYVDIPNPKKDEIVAIGSESGPSFNLEGYRTRDDLTPEEIRSGRWERKIMGTRKSFHGKFYFQHLTIEERRKFVEYMNGKKFHLVYPGYFYVTPFFATRPVKG